MAAKGKPLDQHESALSFTPALGEQELAFLRKNGLLEDLLR